MDLNINTNMSAVTAARSVSSSYNRLAEHTARLSSGLRIISSADDAAGLAVRESLRAETAGLHQAVRNANDLISMGQTADGAMGGVRDNLIRMRELAEQAASATYSPQQREIMAQEFDALAAEIDRVVDSTEFNGTKPLAEAVAAPGGHLGGASGLDVSADVATLTGMTFADVTIEDVDTAIATASGVRATIGSYQNRLAARASALTVQAETTTAAESRISDVDVATEMAAFVQNQVLMQSSLAMMAQAGTTSRMTLKLVP